MGKLSGITGMFKTPAGKTNPDLPPSGKPAGGKTGKADAAGSALDAASGLASSAGGLMDSAGSAGKALAVGSAVMGGAAAVGGLAMVGTSMYSTIESTKAMSDMSKNLGGASALTPGGGANGTG